MRSTGQDDRANDHSKFVGTFFRGMGGDEGSLPLFTCTRNTLRPPEDSRVSRATPGTAEKMASTHVGDLGDDGADVCVCVSVCSNRLELTITHYVY